MKNFKKMLSVILATIMLFAIMILSGCGENHNNGDNIQDEVSIETKNNEITYIADRSVQYNDEDEQWIVFFSFKNSEQVRISGSGTAHIKIVDKKGTSLFNKDIAFTENDFSTWTSGQFPDGRHMCGIYIDRKSVSKGYSESGTLTLSVTTSDDMYFDEDKISITDLPISEAKIKLPSLPATYSYYNYDDSVRSKARVDEITYETSISYDGEMSITFDVLMTCVYDADNTANAQRVGYKLKNSKGIIVDSGHIYSNPIAVGETSYEDIFVYDLDPSDTYTLVLENAA